MGAAALAFSIVGLLIALGPLIFSVFGIAAGAAGIVLGLWLRDGMPAVGWVTQQS